MKSKRLSYFFLPAIVFLIAGCGGIGKMVKKYPTVTYKTTPEILEVHGGKVGVKIDGTFPPKYFNKKATIAVSPVLKFEGGEKALKAINLEGEAVKGGGTVIPAAGGNFSYTDTVMYENGMKKSSLLGEAKVAIGTKSLDLPAIPLAIGTITTSRRVNNSEEPLLGGDKYQKESIISQNAEVYFPIQQSTIMEKEKNSASVKALKEFGKKGYPTKNISITAYASPDGPVDLNDKLSNGRSDNTVKWVKGELKKMKIQGADVDANYSMISKGEYWDGFTRLVNESNMEDKQLIVNIINSHSDVNKREEEIKNLAVVYTKLAKDILPKLRKAEIMINSLEPKKTDAQIDSLALAKPDSLQAEELLYAATLTTDLNKKKKIYESYSQLFPNDWRGPNNVAYICIKQNNGAEAKTNLEKAKGLTTNNGSILNNLGIVTVWEGDLENGMSYYKTAKENGADVNKNMGIWYLRKGMYQSAIQFMGGECSGNLGLAHLSAKNNDEAGKKFDCAEQTANTFYLKAIVGARTNNVDMMSTNLKKAVEMDASFRKEAMEDLEFKKVWESGDFKNAIQ